MQILLVTFWYLIAGWQAPTSIGYNFATNNFETKSRTTMSDAKLYQESIAQVYIAWKSLYDELFENLFMCAVADITSTYFPYQLRGATHVIEVPPDRRDGLRRDGEWGCT